MRFAAVGVGRRCSKLVLKLASVVDAAFVPETAVRARRRREEAVLPVPRGPARSMGVQKAAPSAPACSRWGLLASDDASVPTAASDRSGAAQTTWCDFAS